MHAETGAQAECMRNLYRFLCNPVTLEQSFLGRRVVGHVLDLTETPANRDPSNAASLAFFAETMRQCVEAYVPRTGIPSTDQEAARGWLRARIGFATCHGDGQLIAPTDGAIPSPPTRPPRHARRLPLTLRRAASP